MKIAGALIDISSLNSIKKPYVNTTSNIFSAKIGVSPGNLNEVQKTADISTVKKVVDVLRNAPIVVDHANNSQNNVAPAPAPAFDYSNNSIPIIAPAPITPNTNTNSNTLDVNSSDNTKTFIYVGLGFLGLIGLISILK